MTRLVVFAGTHATDWGVIRQQLVTWRPRLESSGVRLSPGDDAESWSALARELTQTRLSRDTRELLRGAVDDGVDAVLAGSDQLEDPLRDPAATSNLAAHAADLAMPVTIVVVLRDQLGYLNELYVERVTALQMARSFSTFVSGPQPAERFDYPAALQPALDSAGAAVVGVRYSDLSDGAQGRAVLLAAGVSREQVDALPPGVGRAPLPGPVVVAAHRLLYKRAWRLGIVKTLPRGRLLSAGRLLRQRAAERDWDTGEYWGWTSPEREAAVRRYAPGNDRVAMRLWDRPWGDDWAGGAYAEADLAACAPQIVVDVLGTVDTLVRELQRAKAAASAGALTD